MVTRRTLIAGAVAMSVAPLLPGPAIAAGGMVAAGKGVRMQVAYEDGVFRDIEEIRTIIPPCEYATTRHALQDRRK